MSNDFSLTPVAPRKKQPLFQKAIVQRAMRDALVKLDPVVMAKNPVMLVVEVGSLITTLMFCRDL